ncbi:hypothetical protein CAPTEDRAFT_143145, partial [Capitella teleta]
LPPGYVEATVIPEGARNIRVEEVAEANNYLAIKSNKDKYYLNGGWYIQWSGDYQAAGTIIHYHRDGNKESFKAVGPLKEPLHIMLLFQSHNPGVNIEFTVPNENATDLRQPVFFWKYLDWTHCTLSCGGGKRYQRSEVVCAEKEAGLVDEVNCNRTTKPDDMQKTCNVHMCPAKWWVGPWQHCSSSCGTGVHQRTVLCIRTMGPDNQVALDDHECSKIPKPNEQDACHRKNPCPKPQWEAGPWSACSVTCGNGTQIRSVQCPDGVICNLETRPPSVQPCQHGPCWKWVSGPWGKCTANCGSGTQIRSVQCVDIATLKAASGCISEPRPTYHRECNTHKCKSTKCKFNHNAITLTL